MILEADAERLSEEDNDDDPASHDCHATATCGAPGIAAASATLCHKAR